MTREETSKIHSGKFIRTATSRGTSARMAHFRFAKEFNREEQIKAYLEYWRTEEAMAEGSPQTVIAQGEQVDLPPILMLLKANDRNHPLEMQERFIASYRKRGGAIEVQTFDGLPEHRMVPSPSQPETMRAIDTITAFIRRQTG
jgi:hypothetical protein